MKLSPRESDESGLDELSPERLLAMLRAASRETERIGEEDVRGTSTVRYRLIVDCGEAELTCDGTTEVEVWIDDDGLVRRIGIEDDEMRGTIEFFDFGSDVDIEAPPASDVVDLEEAFGPGAGSSGSACSEEGEPISITLATQTLGNHGFDMEEDLPGCGFLSNTTTGDPQTILREDGHVSCLVHPHPEKGAPATTRRRGVDGADAELTLRNLECTIFTDSSIGEEKIDRLEAAFGDLERAYRP